MPTVNGTSDLFHCMVPLKNDQSIIITTLHYDVNTHYSSCTWTTANTTTSLPSIGSTLCYCLYLVYPLLLGLPSATGSTLCYCLYILVYPLLLFIHTGLPSAIVYTYWSSLCYWVYPLLLFIHTGLPSAIVYTYWSTLCYCLYILV